MKENKMSFRDLYRVIEETPSNPVSDAQDELDTAVYSAYGMKSSDDILAFLLDLNHELAEKENNGETIIGPGLPPFIENPNDFIASDCVSMQNQLSDL